ncbi:uncharacterized protein BO66DRAFT_445140 [Aspergillus aculeatinus CBS 121060]|uniref:Uncharacterized protein n=1 Tax=Aspergillus aculeatinus CBS 121060 TaxID=1448322 RepID=A0ACD1HPK2_9EURO|nr:hypothetical protein BO66DRAFT_445140 [Aspergillus aculeatinus CBS 121060]RAH75407.1 hypothetical protein BO66DRAFT_445140 [Aspergillus aculeatinus CBS 121060]
MARTAPGWRLLQSAVRKNGMVLTTRLDVPQPLEVTPSGHAMPRLSTLSPAVDLASSEPNVSVIAKVVEADFFNGLALLDRDTLLSTDSAWGVVYRVKISTGNYSVVLSDPVTMLSPKDSPKPVGVNGLKVHGKYVYYSSTTEMVLARVPFNKDAQPPGPIEIVTGGFTPDDLLLTKNGTAYVTTSAENGLLKVEPSGRVTAVAGALFSTTLAAIPTTITHVIQEQSLSSG